VVSLQGCSVNTANSANSNHPHRKRVGRNQLVTLPWLPYKVARYDTASLVTSSFMRAAALCGDELGLDKANW
jgi:hypothetical protein